VQPNRFSPSGFTNFCGTTVKPTFSLLTALWLTPLVTLHAAGPQNIAASLHPYVTAGDPNIGRAFRIAVGDIARKFAWQAVSLRSALTALLLAPLAVLHAAAPSKQAPAIGPVQVAMDRAAKCCLAWLNPEQHYLPTGGYETAHDTGRWWDAMLRYEAATGVRIPAQAENAMMANLRTLTDNPAALLTSSLCNPHNLRESLLAYTALVRHRKDAWAEQQARRLIATMAELIEADGQMDYSGLAARVGKPLTKDTLMMRRFPAGEWFNAVGSTGRALEALMEFHAATGDETTLKLAKRLAEVQMRTVIDPSGKVRAELLAADCVSHTLSSAN